MKYEPIRVISQMTAKRTRPIEREPPQFISHFPHRAPRSRTIRVVRNPKRGEYITGISRSKQVLARAIVPMTSDWWARGRDNDCMTRRPMKYFLEHTFGEFPEAGCIEPRLPFPET